MKHVIEHNIESIGMRWDPSRRAGKKSWQDLAERVEKVRALMLLTHHRRVRVSGELCLPYSIYCTRWSCHTRRVWRVRSRKSCRHDRSSEINWQRGDLKCICLFLDAILDAVHRPLILEYNGYSSHKNGEIAIEAVRIVFIIYPLLANLHHLLQSLDEAVLNPI